jgi:phytanoyl-CoA hydroxylase
MPNEALTFWIPLDDVDDENGALHYVTGSQNAGILSHHSSGVMGFSQGLDATDFTPYGQEVICEVRRGDTLVHHCRTIHLAKANFSSRQRRVIGQVYFAKRAKVDPAMKSRYEESLAAQRKAAGVT